LADIRISDKVYAVDLVIFDKDGTLLDFKATWIGIMRELINSIGRRVKMHEGLKQRIEGALGIYVDKVEIDGYGPLAMGTFSECDTMLVYCLYREGIRWDKARDIVSEATVEVFSSEIRRKGVTAAKGSIELLTRLKKRGIAIAVATNDNVKDSTKDMEEIGASKFIDLVVGADSVTNSKPHPDMIEMICSKLNISAGRAIMIGDTVMDALLGKRAKVALTVGVCGLLPKAVLHEYNDVVVETLDEIK
jgi:phosphoglycolate phosphatase